MAPLLRVRPEFHAVCRFASQWDAPHDAEPAGWAQFHIVKKGNCLLERSDGHPLRLEAGDVLLLPHGNAHVVRSSACTRGPKSPIRIEYGNAIETRTNTEGEAVTELMRGRLLDLLILDDFEPLGYLFAPDGHRRRCSETITFLMSDPRRISMPMPDRNSSHRRDAVSVGFTRSDGRAVNRR
jgi:hypothetical protein